MGDLNKFKAVPEGESISYEHLVFYLEQGREIEFVYKGKEYFISHSSVGRAVWNGQTRLSEYFDDNHKAVVDVKVEGVTLIELFKQNKIEITTIF